MNDCRHICVWTMGNLVTKGSPSLGNQLWQVVHSTSATCGGTVEFLCQGDGCHYILFPDNEGGDLMSSQILLSSTQLHQQAASEHNFLMGWRELLRLTEI
jgi:hypothetical protein